MSITTIIILFVVAFLCFKGAAYFDKKEKQIKSGEMPQEEIEKWAKTGENLKTVVEGAAGVSGILGGIVGLGLAIYAISVLMSL